jgi:hypothetical protein
MILASLSGNTGVALRTASRSFPEEKKKEKKKEKGNINNKKMKKDETRILYQS